jgi:hypothetical protein
MAKGKFPDGQKPPLITLAFVFLVEGVGGGGRKQFI